MSITTLGCSHDLAKGGGDDDEVERDVDGHDADRQRDGFLEPLQEHAAEDEQQHDRQQQRMIDPGRRQRVLNQMRRGVGRRQRDR